MYISVRVFSKGCAQECKWADEILASCETLQDAVRCQSSLAVPERGSIFGLWKKNKK